MCRTTQWMILAACLSGPAACARTAATPASLRSPDDGAPATRRPADRTPVAGPGNASPRDALSARSQARPPIAWDYDVDVADPHALVLHVDARFAAGTSDALTIDEGAADYVQYAEYESAGAWAPLRPAATGWMAPCRAQATPVDGGVGLRGDGHAPRDAASKAGGAAGQGGAGGAGDDAAGGREGCHVRYDFALGRAADRMADVDKALRAGEVVVAPPSTWLMHPATTDGDGRFRVRLTTPPEVAVATGIAPALDAGEGVALGARAPAHASTKGEGVGAPADASTKGEGAGAPAEARASFEARIDDLEAASFVVFGAFGLYTVDAGGGTRVDVAVARYGLAMAPADAVQWVGRGVDAIRRYFGGFPVRHVLVAVLPGTGDVTAGETIGEGGPTVVVRAAPGLTAAASREDWVVTHELLHAALPSFGRDHAWLDEGIATYLEPIARARAGLVGPEQYWRELTSGLPQGQPEPGDQGLERTHTWGRTYWGGALFCFVADVRVREATHGARSFDDALRALARGDGDPRPGGDRVEVEAFLAVADRATGTNVFSSLYRELALAPGHVDLPALWTTLGVRISRAPAGPEGNSGPPASRVVFDDAAPLAGLRRAMTSPAANRAD